MCKHVRNTNVPDDLYKQWVLEALDIVGEKRHGLYKPEEVIGQRNFIVNTVQDYNEDGTFNFSNSWQNTQNSGKFVPVRDEEVRIMIRGCKQYELSNHLGNVLVTVSDRKSSRASSTTATLAEYYVPYVLTISDYYAFGSSIKERTVSFSATYRYGFNGQEKDGGPESHREGDYYAFEYRIHDARLGRFLSVDPHYYSYTQISVFAFCIGNPILYLDPDGRDIIFGTGWESSKPKLAYDIIRSFKIAYFEAAIAPFENNKSLNLTLNVQTTTENPEFIIRNCNAFTQIDPIIINNKPVNAVDMLNYRFNNQTINFCSDAENIIIEYRNEITKVAQEMGVLNNNEYYIVKYFPKEIDYFLNVAHEILHTEMNSKPVETRGCLDNNCQHEIIANSKQTGILELLTKANETQNWGFSQKQLESVSWYGIHKGDIKIELNESAGYGSQFNNDFLVFATKEMNNSLAKSNSSYIVDAQWWTKDINSTKYLF